jgi:hypothetical protein
MLALRRGEFDEAEREGLVALEMERAQENRHWAFLTLAGLAQVALARGDLERAGLLWGAADKEGETRPRWADERDRRGGALVEENREPFVQARERGRALDLWDAAAIALGAG